MQASYIMVANKAALPYLPSGADINALSYDKLAARADTIQEKTCLSLLGFPAGPQGLTHRFFSFFEGFLYPSYRRGLEAAEAMWMQFASLWKRVNPDSGGPRALPQFFARHPLTLELIGETTSAVETTEPMLTVLVNGR
jgi:multiple sugar transport system substrate-binding protein